MEKKRFDFSKLIGFNIYTIALILIVFLGGVGLTYAYYAFSYEEESVIAGNVIAIDIDLEVELVVGTNEEMVPLNNDALSNALKGVGSTNGACVDSVGNLSCQVYKITLINKGSRVKHMNGTIELYAKGGIGNVYNNLKWREITNPTTIKSDAVINGMSESVLVSDLTMESKTEKTWYIAVWISETNSDQRETDKGLFGGTVTFIAGSGSGSSGTSGTKATDYIINKYNDGSTITTVNIGGSTDNPEVHLNETQSIMLDNNGEYRYYGADPNNYVWYNDELWRIISVGNVKSNETDTVGETRVKIVKASYMIAEGDYDSTFGYSSETTYSWDYNSVNDWSKSDLMLELNDFYFNSTNGTCYGFSGTFNCKFVDLGLDQQARNLVDDALFYLGAVPHGNYNADIGSMYADDYYTYERGTMVYDCATNDGACPRVTSWSGKVGLMYASDYVYATDLGICTKMGTEYETDAICTENDWIFYSDQWFITPSSNNSSVQANYSSRNGNLESMLVKNSKVVFPTVYLKSEVIIVDGEGTSEKPYILGLDFKEKVTDYVINKYRDGSTITQFRIANVISNPAVKLNTNNGIMLDNNGVYRYYGANPNNYVWYNDELWRIISVGNVRTDALDKFGETRAKIVKASYLIDDNSLSSYSWDSSISTVNSGYGVNDWSQADLMTELNTLYFNSTSGICYTGQNNVTTACDFTNTGLGEEARNLTGDALYYLGGYSTSEGLYPNHYYTIERGTEVYICSTNDVACPRATRWIGRIGIIYSSDYAYATDLSVCTIDPYNYGNDEDCYGKNWLLYGSSQFTITPRSSNARNAFRIYASGQIKHTTYTSFAAKILPVQYLKSNVLITGGEGTIEKPYKLSISN